MPSVWRRVLGSVRALTARGRSFLVLAVACLTAAILLGEQDLLRVAVLLAVLPLTCLVATTRVRYRLRCSRSVSPPRVHAGGRAMVSLRLDNLGRLPTSTLVVEDTVPYVLGRRPRFVLTRVAAGSHRVLGYTVQADVRGRYQLGPLSVRLRDPFGCCELTRSFSSSGELIVTPATVPLPVSPLWGAWLGSGEDGAVSGGIAGDDDATVRDYRQGDDLRRVHWPSTARSGLLMVRREATPYSAQATVLLEDRLTAHRGTGPTSSFERAVSIAASVVEHLCSRGIRVRLLTTSGQLFDRRDIATARVALLDELAGVQARRVTRLVSPLTALAGQRATGSLVAVLGALDDTDARALAALPRGPSPHLAILLDTAGWSGLSAAARTSADGRLGRARDLLDVSGWRTGVATLDGDLADTWRRLTSGPLRRVGGRA